MKRPDMHCGPAPHATQPMEELHIDLVGPFKVSHDSSSYAMPIIDGFSRRAWVIFLPKKASVGESLLPWLNGMPNSYGKVARIHHNQGGEFLNGALQHALRKCGIEPRVTPSHTPEYNGVVERLNQTLNNSVRCALASARLPNSWWTHVMCHVVAVYNHLPHSLIDYTSPLQRFRGDKQAPSVRHLHAFGCPAHIYIQPSNHAKLDDRSHPGIYVGQVSNDSHFHRVFFPDTNHIIETRDVVFEEDNITLSVFKPTPLGIPSSLDDESDSYSDGCSSALFRDGDRSGDYRPSSDDGSSSDETNDTSGDETGPNSNSELTSESDPTADASTASTDDEQDPSRILHVTYT